MACACSAHIHANKLRCSLAILRLFLACSIHPLPCGNRPPLHLENNGLNAAEIALMKAPLTDCGPIQILSFTLSDPLVQCTWTWLCFSPRQLTKQRLLLFLVPWASWVIGRCPVSAGTSTAAVGSLTHNKGQCLDFKRNKSSLNPRMDRGSPPRNGKHAQTPSFSHVDTSDPWKHSQVPDRQAWCG